MGRLLGYSAPTGGRPHFGRLLRCVFQVKQQPPLERVVGLCTEIGVDCKPRVLLDFDLSGRIEDSSETQPRDHWRYPPHGHVLSFHGRLLAPRHQNSSGKLTLLAQHRSLKKELRNVCFPGS